MKLYESLSSLTRGKRVLILGFGREGRATYRELMACRGWRELWIADQNPQEELLGVDGYLWGEEYQKHLNEFDVVFKSPGVVLMQEAETLQCILTSQMEVFFEAYRSQIIGITGTKGKSTTTTLIYHILKQAGTDALIAGNIGIPVFDVAENVTEQTVLVCEMSSHQLEYMEVSPHIGVYLNVHEEHLDHYGTMEKYVAAKERIYRNMREEDILFCNEAVCPKGEDCAARIVRVSSDSAKAELSVRNHRVVYRNLEEECSYSIPVGEISLLGKHNEFNIGVAYGVCKCFGITDAEFEAGLRSYETLPHRLQYIGTYGGVKYYDDSISTICDTVLQALESIGDVATVLIGGMDRGIDYTELIEGLDQNPVEHILLMEATGKRIYETIHKEYPEFRNPDRLKLVAHLEDAVELGKQLTPFGRSCVLSPGAASYGIFKNFEERGERFLQLVKGI